MVDDACEQGRRSANTPDIIRGDMGATLRGRQASGNEAMEPHPWLKPLSRRVGVVIACLAWLGFEATTDPGGLWFWLALGATAYAIWDFFLSGSYRAASK